MTKGRDIFRPTPPLCFVRHRRKMKEEEESECGGVKCIRKGRKHSDQMRNGDEMKRGTK